MGWRGSLPDETRVLYVSPLKALSNDIHKNLEEPLAEIRAALRASRRPRRGCPRRSPNGRHPRRQTPGNDSQAAAYSRHDARVALSAAHVDSGRKMLATVRTLIVDEIHAVVGNRRGSHLALSMERLAALVDDPLQRIGLSATQKPIEEVARFLVGTRNLDETGNAHCAIVDSGHTREMDLAIELPGSPLEAVMSNEVWTEVYRRLAELIRRIARRWFSSTHAAWPNA